MQLSHVTGSSQTAAKTSRHVPSGSSVPSTQYIFEYVEVYENQHLPFTHCGHN